MRALTGLFLIAFSCATLNGTVREQRSFSDVIQRCEKGVVAVMVGEKTVATGFYIGEGRVLTAWHVVAGQNSWTVQLHNCINVTAVVVAADASGLALLRVPAAGDVYIIPLALRDPAVGESVIAYGHPYGYRNTITRGIISSSLKRKIEFPSGQILYGLLQTDAAINSGNSGGPLINKFGEVVGVVQAIHQDAHGIAFATGVKEIKVFLSKALVR